MNTIGLLVYNEKLENFQGMYHKKICKENFATGIYFVEVVVGNEKKITKIMMK